MHLIKEGKNYSISSECPKSQIPRGFWVLPFNKIVSKVLSAKKSTSIVFVKQQKIKSLNNKFLNKNYSTDVLSFPLESGGEILFSINDARKKAKNYNLKTDDYLSYLLIHALLHLKGLKHGSKMNILEQKFCRFFGIRHPFFNEP